jgi:hypothetical protein
LKQDIIKIFKKEGLNITINVNLKVVEFLDVELNLETETHKPFTKPNNTILYVNADSNHPQSMKRNIPLACQKRLSLLSSNEDIFNAAAPEYQEALDKAGYKYQLRYDHTAKIGVQGKRYRAKEETWFNPPFSQNVKSNIGADFLKSVDSSFPKDHPLRSICNRNTLKLSYRTTSNMSQVISRHNKKVSSVEKEPIIPAKADCNCQKSKLPCIMGGKCVPGCVVYQGAVTRKDTGQTDYYTGLSEPSWKLRYANHKQNFKVDNQQNRTATCLSKHIWKLKDQNIGYSLKFKQLIQAQAFNPVTGMCRLCLSEKYFIMFKPEGANINSRSEFFAACRHKTKLLLCPPSPEKKARPKL